MTQTEAMPSLVDPSTADPSGHVASMAMQCREPILSVTTTTGGQFFVLSADWAAACEHIYTNVPLCDLAGRRIESLTPQEQRGRRSRLRTTSIATVEEVAVEAEHQAQQIAPATEISAFPYVLSDAAENVPDTAHL